MRVEFKVGDKCWVARQKDGHPTVGFFTVLNVEQRKDKIGRELGHYVTLQGTPESEPFEERVTKSARYLYGYYKTPEEAIVGAMERSLRDAQRIDSDFMIYAGLNHKSIGENVECARRIVKDLSEWLALYDQVKSESEEKEQTK